MLEYEILRGSEFLDILIQLIDSAKKRIYIATYIASLNNQTEEVYYASARRHKYGVDVKFLLDGASSESDKYNRLSAEFLKSLGIPVIRTNKFMHIKLYIIDNYIIIGSHNLTAHKEKNSYDISVMIESKKASSKLSNFFLTIYNDKNPDLIIDKDILEDGTQYEIISNYMILDNIYEKTLYSSKRVKILMYIASLSKITKKYYKLLKDKESKGVDVAVVLDGMYRISRHYNTKVYKYLSSIGLKKIALTSRFNHAKIIVIDDYTTIGSHNLTSSSLAGRMELAIILKNNKLSTSMEYIIDDILAKELENKI
ncbi:MAG: phosphatidylserine/phosphatidylglycerophosphate/cardiolipin synthase family protein [Ignisphaera sp.]